MSSKNKLISFHQKPSIVLKVVSLSPKLIFLSSPFLKQNHFCLVSMAVISIQRSTSC